jgi:BirA family transcriptional regulator, biotin operon repressor / biotin---[acetyl-CoA-carboxylase] ligase
MDISRLVRETFVAEVEHREELGSTNDRALQRAKQGATHLPLLVIADRQTAGRGRGGNRWWTGYGSLAFSLLLESIAPPEDSAAKSGPLSSPRRETLLGLAAGVAVGETLRPLLGATEIGILWPNDVIAAGRKLAGILVEVLPDGSAVIGIGINTNVSMKDAPADLLTTATTLLEITGTRQDHVAILVSLLNRLQKDILALRHTPAHIAAEANRLCLQHGKPLTLQQERQTISGVCRGIASDGALLLETPNGVRSYYSGRIIRSVI